MTESEPVLAQIHVEAAAEVVFEYFTRPDLLVGWMGEFARLDPAPGGTFEVDVRGAPIRGCFREVEPPRRLLIGWGYAGSETLPPGASSVEVSFVPEGAGTTVRVRHSGIPAEESPGHGAGWPYYLSRLKLRAEGVDLEPDSGHGPPC